MPKLVVLIGNAAVGKMTVGQELMKITGLKLFHNHMTIEPVIEIFGDYRSNVVARLRKVIFEEFVKSDLEGLIFTFMMAFNLQEDWDYLKTLTDIFETQGNEVYYVELVADVEERLRRNRTPNRLQYKKSKQDIQASTERLLQDDAKYRLESFAGEVPFKNYIKMDTTHLEATQTAKQIKEYFKL